MHRSLLLLAVLPCLLSCGVVRPVFQAVTRPLTELSGLDEKRLAYHLHQSAIAWDEMRQTRSKKKRQSAQESYHKHLASFIEVWNEQQSPRQWQSGRVFTTLLAGKQPYRVTFAAPDARRRGLSPLEYDSLLLSDDVRWREKDTLATRSGIGVPIIGHMERTAELRRELPYIPPSGGNVTLTLLMDVSAPDAAGSRTCTLRLHDALNEESVRFRDAEQPLAANFTAPKKLSLQKKAFGQISLQGLLYPEKALGDCQLYRMDAYDPQRIPVVFVHGLMSDPHIWLNAVNAIAASPELRRRYQPWYFLYPTAIGVPQAARKLRETLLNARQHFDPDHNDPGFNQMILIGHSMGGLLSRLQVTESKDCLWCSVFTKPLDQMQVSEELRQNLQHTLYTQPLPFVKRVIFIATPHRGSSIASLSIVRALTGLIRVPLDVLDNVNQLLRGNQDALSPQLQQWGIFSFMSVGMLSEKHPLLIGLDRTRPSVPYHSIIGTRSTTSDITRSSDGVVPYLSSHLESAQSEMTVPHGHRCVQEADVIAEVMRILRLHAP
jgi:triacylglycerol esterase/lipase EstA (alpha/beta hydrolase family)